MRNILLTTIGMATIANAQCIGNSFFHGESDDFNKGLTDVCFGMDIESVKDNISPKKVIETYTDYSKKKIKSPEAWIDSVNFQNWFNDGGRHAAGNIFYANWINGSAYSLLESVTSRDFGIKTLYVGNRETHDTVLAFTFYTGQSELFIQRKKGKYTNFRTVSGLFDITLSVKHFVEQYFTSTLDNKGYGLGCNKKQSSQACAEVLGGRTGRSVIRPKDKDVAIVYDPSNKNVHIRIAADMSSLIEAMQDNIRIKYDKAVAEKRKKNNLND